MYVQTVKFSISSSMKYYVTSITKIVLHFLAKCKGTDTNQLLPSIVKWQALISLAQFGEKKNVTQRNRLTKISMNVVTLRIQTQQISKKSSDENFNECRHISHPYSTDLSSPLHGPCDEDVNSYFCRSVQYRSCKMLKIV